MVKEIGTSDLIEAWATSGTRVYAGITKTIQGWLTTEKPPSQWFNFKMHETDTKLNHVLQNGVPLWNAGTSYSAGNCVGYLGRPWVALNPSLNSPPSLVNSDWVALAYLSEVNSIVPIGCGVWTYNTTASAGFIFYEGQAISRVQYPQLFAALGTTFGAGDGVTTFNVPDERGEFFRGFDNGRGVDAGRTLGSKQSQAIQSHSHGNVPLFVGADSDRGGSPSAFSIDNIGTTAAAGGAETRPRNIAGRYMYRLG